MSPAKVSSQNGAFQVVLSRVEGDPLLRGRCLAQMYRVEGDQAKLVWARSLINEQRPCELLVTNKGELVTLDDSQRLGKHPVVCYGTDGKLGYIGRLEDFPELLNNQQVRTTESGVRWREASACFLSDLAQCLVIVPPRRDPIVLRVPSGLRLSSLLAKEDPRTHGFDWRELEAEIQRKAEQAGIERPAAAREMKPKTTKRTESRMAPGAWHPDTLRLLSLETRDEAMQNLLKQGVYPENPSYTEDRAGKVKEVVICPQPGGRPLLAVFAGSEFERSDVSPRSGHLVVIRNDGVIFPYYQGANSIDGYLMDLNGDGVMDCLDSLDYGYDEGTLTGLYLVPITEDFEPALVVYWKKESFEWRSDQPEPERNPTIQIGRKRKGSFETVAEYRWSREEMRWVGPKGSLRDRFWRVDGDPDETAKKLLGPESEVGADQPATAPESKPVDEEKPKQESEERSK